MARVLVVEDDPVSAKILGNMLKKREHESYVASGVGEAIAFIERKALTDLVILDNQLQGEYGWQFLDYLRKDFIFRTVPVLVYTGSSDRNSVLKYLQHGVQKILVKPYNATHIEEEIGKAVQFDWRGMVFESAARVCHRLNISEDEYYKSLIRGAVEVKEHVPAMNKLVGSKDLRVFDEHLSALQSMALNLGVSLLENAVESIQTTLREGKLDQCIYLINRLVPTARLMYHRALAHFGMDGDTGAFPKDLFDQSVETRVRKTRSIPGMPVVLTDDPLDQMVESPISAFTDDFKLLSSRGVFKKNEVEAAIYGRNPAAGISDIISSMSFLRTIGTAAVDVITAYVDQIPHMNARLLEIAGVVSTRGTRLQGLNDALNVMGASMACCIAIPVSWLRASRMGRNPLRLEALARHNMAVSLMVRELAIKFGDAHDFSSASLAYTVGHWLLAIQYPAFYGMSMVLARQNPAEQIAIERSFFGTDHCEMSSQLTAKMRFPKSVISAAYFVCKPDEAPDNESRLLSAMVNLADILSRINRIGFGGSDMNVNADTFINSPAWVALHKAQVTIPLEPPEYLTALSPIVDRVRHIVDMAFE